MSIETKVKGRFIFYSVGQKTEHPVAEVLSILSGETQPNRRLSKIIDFSSLKRSRFPEGSIDELFSNMSEGSNYLFVFPDNMLAGVKEVARKYGYESRIRTKKSTAMLASLSGAY